MIEELFGNAFVKVTFAIPSSRSINHAENSIYSYLLSYLKELGDYINFGETNSHQY